MVSMEHEKPGITGLFKLSEITNKNLKTFVKSIDKIKNRVYNVFNKSEQQFRKNGRYKL